jgi:hypothetical protein
MFLIDVLFFMFIAAVLTVGCVLAWVYFVPTTALLICAGLTINFFLGILIGMAIVLNGRR